MTKLNFQLKNEVLEKTVQGFSAVLQPLVKERDHSYITKKGILRLVMTDAKLQIKLLMAEYLDQPLH